MTIETATFVGDLDPTEPGATDFVSEGDDHLRLLKSILQATFPDATEARYLRPATQDEAEQGTVVGGDNQALMTPLTTMQAIDYQRPFASQLAAELGEETTSVMTPERVLQAINARLTALGLL